MILPRSKTVNIKIGEPVMFHNKHTLEDAVAAVDNKAVAELIAGGIHLNCPDILATPAAFNLRYPVAVLLLESAECDLSRLEELGAHPEMAVLGKETSLPLSANSNPKAQELLDALADGDEVTVANLIVNDDAFLSSAEMEYFDNVTDFTEFTTEFLFSKALDARLQAKLFLHLCKKVKIDDNQANRRLMEIMKIILVQSDSLEREKNLHKVWREYSTSSFIKKIEKNPEFYSEEFLADLIIDGELEFDSKPFNTFSPYYQALMLNHGGVGIDTFEAEAEIENFDAQAVFELLSCDDTYADRVNWDLVNKTAAAPEFFRFLASNPQYAGKADWKMLNIHGSTDDWMLFLSRHPEFLEKLENHERIYQYEPERWKIILANSGISCGSHFAVIAPIIYSEPIPCEDFSQDEYPPYEIACKIRINGRKLEFYDAADPDTIEKFNGVTAETFGKFRSEMMESMNNNFEPIIDIIR